jgi:hypothetical protein
MLSCPSVQSLHGPPTQICLWQLPPVVSAGVDIPVAAAYAGMPSSYNAFRDSSL